MYEAFNTAAKEITDGILDAIREIKPSQVGGMLDAFLEARCEERKILVVGSGRSGLVGKAFAMRLMHLGFNIYVMGETITPAIGDDDLVLVISGSGSTTLPLTVAEKAKSIGARVIAVTSHPTSPLGVVADLVVNLPGREVTAREDEYHSRQILGNHEPLSPMGTMFEDSCMVFLDSIIAELIVRVGMSEDAMKSKHATIE
ncbi:MAG: 6-phospho-3-hexuloisomerase [Candidatus Bathyarchaeia archaeon]